MGMLSGSSASNVVTTGSYTIPAMRRSGFSAPFAAGVEAVASSGGQLTPPIMGAAAFLMVEFVGVPYIEVIKAAIIPAILYFLAVFVMVDQSARYLDIAKQDTSSNRVLPLLLKKGYLLIPVVIMLYVLVQGFTPTAAGFWSIISLIILCIVVDKNNRKRILVILYEAFTEAPKIIGPVAVACAIGGIIAGITITTGLGVKMSSIILGISRGNIPLTMLLTMFIAIFLGMGMPTSGAYIVLAALLAPGLVKLGIPVMAAHMFIIFSAASSTITPPVAIASYAAAAIADTDPWKTSVIAFKLGLSVFIIPFLFVYNPALLGDEGIPNALLAFLPAAVSVICLSMAIIGYFRRKMTIWERLGFLSVSIILITTSWKNIFAAIVIISVLIFIGNFLYKNKKERA
jgi:TRAP transporter 4TM/12TM fusion protein